MFLLKISVSEVFGTDRRERGDVLVAFVIGGFHVLTLAHFDIDLFSLLVPQFP